MYLAFRDIATLTVFLFILGVGLSILYLVSDRISTEMIANPSVNSSSATVTAFHDLQNLNERMDYLFLGFFLALIIGLVITAYLIGGHPIGIIFFYIVGIISVMLSIYLSNAWEQNITTIPEFSVISSTLKITNNILLNLPIYATIAYFIAVVVMHAKPSGGRE